MQKQIKQVKRTPTLHWILDACDLHFPWVLSHNGIRREKRYLKFNAINCLVWFTGAEDPFLLCLSLCIVRGKLVSLNTYINQNECLKQILININGCTHTCFTKKIRKQSQFQSAWNQEPSSLILNARICRSLLNEGNGKVMQV